MRTEVAIAFAVVAVISFLLFLFFTQGCQLKHPVPCDPRVQWPDPCVEGVVETVTDAGADSPGDRNIP